MGKIMVNNGFVGCIMLFCGTNTAAVGRIPIFIALSVGHIPKALPSSFLPSKWRLKTSPGASLVLLGLPPMMSFW